RQQTADGHRAAANKTRKLIGELPRHRIETLAVYVNLKSHYFGSPFLGWGVFYWQSNGVSNKSRFQSHLASARWCASRIEPSAVSTVIIYFTTPRDKGKIGMA